MSGREEDKHENRTEHNPNIPGAAGIPQGADSARAEEAEPCTNSGARVGLHRGRIYGRDSVHRSCFAVLFASRADIKNERLHNGRPASKHSNKYSTTY